MATAAIMPSNTQPQAQPPTIAVQRSSLDGLTSPRTSNDAQWGAHFWVTLSDPQTGAQFFACPSTGDCSWEPPIGNFVDTGQWWELSDDTRDGLSYYYHTLTGETRWEKPDNEFVIPLRVIQNTSIGRRLSISAMSRRVSVVEPPLHDSIPEADEQPTPTPRRSHSNPDHRHPQRPPKPVRTTKPPALSTTPTPAATAAAPSKPSVPPSPARQRVSKPIPNPRLPQQQQSLDAAAQLLASRPSDLSRRPAVPGPVDHQIGRPSFTTPERRPRLTTEIPPATATASASAGATAPNGYTSLAVPLLPRRTATAPAEDGRTRLRRHTNASTKDITISSPILNHALDATKNMSPFKNPNGKPIPTRDFHVHTKRLSTGEHHMLPRGLVEDIQQFQVEDFAKRYFSTHRAGFLFRRRIPVEQLMTWQKAPLQHPLLVLNRSLHKDAVKMFKVIQRIMGDRDRDRLTGIRVPPDRDGYTSGRESGRESESGNSFRGSFVPVLEEERWLLAEGLLHGELRDEIYCQVVKQLTKNPTPESVFKGWQLLCVLLVTFPPSKNFEVYLRSFMRERTTQKAGRIDVMARFCIGKLSVIAKKGPRGKPPTPQEIEIASDAAFNPSTFGESLDAIFKMQERTYPTAKVPIVLPFLSDGILALGGMKAEGIFRVPGEGDIVAELRARIDRGYYNLEGIDDPHVPASLFKLWLRELQEPLIPDELYDECITGSEDPEKVVRVVYEKLPVVNRRVLLFVISFLQMFLEESVTGTTKMTAPNLALVFAPNILRCASESMAVVFANARFEQIFVHNLLLHCNCATLDPDYVPVHGVGPQ